MLASIAEREQFRSLLAAKIRNNGEESVIPHQDLGLFRKFSARMLHDVVEPAGGQDRVHPEHGLGHEADKVAGLGPTGVDGLIFSNLYGICVSLFYRLIRK